MPRLPLEGIRILDLTAVWAGPYATRLLADMGAEVIKVEGAANPDMLRSLAFLPEPDPRSYNKAAYFNHNNRNKLACSIDLNRPEGIDLVLRLAAVSDVIIENFRADVMDRLGLSYERVKAARPDIIYVSMPGHGKSGRERGYVAYGTNVEQLAGLVSVTGYLGGPPQKSGISYGDPTAGTAAAGAVVCALVHRQRTGQGQRVELAQREAVTTMIGEYVVGYSITREIPERLGNRHPYHAPHGCYPAAGEDKWVVIACRNDAELCALCAVMEREDLTRGSRFADEASRYANQADLDEVIAGWTSGLDREEAAQRLQAAGVPAAPVLNHVDLLEDEHLRKRGFFEEVEHPEAGNWPMEGPVWRFHASQPHIRHNAPMFAEHNDYVLRGLLGLSESEVRGLIEAGVVGVEPNMAGHL
jgi:crotonobetainyl-CoA:carnitine CoA-transferase CaiB-like acyl-CoA transferase